MSDVIDRAMLRCMYTKREDWCENVGTIARRHRVGAGTLAKVRQVIDMAEAAHAANPITEVPAPAPSVPAESAP